ncbi:hypothetical protein KVR01_013012 [Diaporthe batatas]|uniref:uncharacterized protein n=1 Tax=Diaporthe batatas TaxID=748121 RepID=UPI001D051BDE|nr:uncharacterized protein KVR01_013012 [Diaporthe batatas]KAG8157022.1 hypothetical protein KVR01_013012 [Diaporthe batatas]
MASAEARAAPSQNSHPNTRPFCGDSNLATQPNTMLCQLLAWLLRRIMPFNIRQPCADPPLRDGREDLETLRARHAPRRPLNAPIPTDSPTEAAYLAGATALPGLIRAVLDETHPCMIIARAAQAISIAASTSQSHAALLAAVNTMETLAILAYEEECDPEAFDLENELQILGNSIDTPVRRALAQKPPSNSFIPHYDPLPAGAGSADTVLADRAFLETFILNKHIIRPST